MLQNCGVRRKSCLPLLITLSPEYSEMQSPGAWPGLKHLSEKRLRVCLLVFILVLQLLEGDVRDLRAQLLARLEYGDWTR